VDGYPFPGGTFWKEPGNRLYDREVDTNGDGVFDRNDDPFTPFYPGDEWVTFN
jgi:hypothetical protein